MIDESQENDFMSDSDEVNDDFLMSFRDCPKNGADVPLSDHGIFYN